MVKSFSIPCVFGKQFQGFFTLLTIFLKHLGLFAPPDPLVPLLCEMFSYAVPVGARGARCIE